MAMITHISAHYVFVKMERSPCQFQHVFYVVHLKMHRFANYFITKKSCQNGNVAWYFDNNDIALRAYVFLISNRRRKAN